MFSDALDRFGDRFRVVGDAVEALEGPHKNAERS